MEKGCISSKNHWRQVAGGNKSPTSNKSNFKLLEVFCFFLLSVALFIIYDNSEEEDFFFLISHLELTRALI